MPAKIIGYEEEDIDMGSIKAIMYWMTFSAGATILIYNLVILAHIYSESVSIVKSERYIVKKEVEFCLGISYNWLTSYFFYFSSFRPGIWKQFFNPVFNIMRVLMVAAYALIDEEIN